MAGSRRATRDRISSFKYNFEIYNVPKFIPEHSGRPHPEIFKRHWATIEWFSKHIHDQIIWKLLAIFAITLDLEDEDWFAK
ncbi:hypothetical protein FOQG_14851 [Fusarium oxysporum f. sp. raphani 54005]|uniref:Uncharacterized protein n=2 Tax=Fusarium oxysporum f. sp. raphani TaxID=96318 RepID=X0BER9_FUSOX|nr:hypothetical protein FOQG_14851 [Fusarium oxysporum f. sp. raphani 54005]KAG7438434.1 hypothetical protein Forpi1262_v001976 [Fusarium oxysporum f. sp. raphani]